MKNIIDASPLFEATLNDILHDEQFLRNEIFRIPAVRDALVIDRYKNLFHSLVSTKKSSASSKITIEHNTDFDRMFFSDLSRRPDLISNVLSSLSTVRQNASRMRVLSIGSRTEAELFSLVNAGFYLGNIECVDLFSYSPYIKVGDLHNLEYAHATFDVLVCGWVLEFCGDISLACAEIKRVTKPGGLICIGGMHHPSSTNMKIYNRHKNHEDRVWYCSIDAIKAYFDVDEKAFVFKSDVETLDLDKRCDVIAIFKNGAVNV